MKPSERPPRAWRWYAALILSVALMAALVAALFVPVRNLALTWDLGAELRSPAGVPVRLDEPPAPVAVPAN